MNRNPNPPPKHVQFKKGQKTPGAGRPALAKKELRLYTAQTIAETLVRLQSMPFEQVKAISQRTDVPALEKVVARGIVHDSLVGNMGNFEKILIRCIGSVPTKQEITGAQGVPLIPPQIIFKGDTPKEGAGTT